MDFCFTDEQGMIADTVQNALGNICTTTQLRQLIAAGQTHDSARWSMLAELGICGTLLTEDVGGLGLEEVTMCRIAQSCGASLLPEPLVNHAGVALPLLADIAKSENAPELQEVIKKMALGDGYAVLFHPQQPFTQGADRASFIICADNEGALSYGPPEAFELTAQPTADPLVILWSCYPTRTSKQIAPGPAINAALARATARGSLFCAAELLGVAEAALELSVAYAKERQQFGRPIGSNQAIKHMLAEVQVQTSFLHPVLFAAAALAGQNDTFARGQISHAWLRARAVADKATRVAVQVHGAMGYSWETDVHLFVKRSLVLGGMWGTFGEHMNLFSKRVEETRFL
jgi:alkylation response protein AidB-like acyl-CoA dehydrogenase